MNAALLFWIVALVPFLPFTLQSGNSGRQCPCNQTATECTPCEQICNQPAPFCPAICRMNNTCRCDNGFLRLAANRDRCVLKKDCPPPKPTCPRNQTATECTPCDQICNQEPRVCTKICIANSTCGCDTGYLRADENGNRCVLKKDCPPPKPTCPVNQTATECVPCNQICSGGPKACSQACAVNATFCQCKSGYQLIEGTKRCVLAKDCPKPTHQCPCNSTATTCAPCNPICNEGPRPCPRLCTVNATQCKCDEGYQQIDASTNRCVLKKDCPPPKPTCPSNQTATECTPCDQICNKEPRVCTKICIANSTCGCDTGYLRADKNSNRCVLKKDCPPPKPTHQCPSNQTATSCAPCNPICNLGPRPCPLFCTVNATLCKCDEGYEQVDANTNRCVLKKDCPPPKPTCSSNQTATECTPCDQICNQESRVCTKICIANSTCGCDTGYFRVDENSKRCVLKKDCPLPKPTCARNQTATECTPCDQICNQEPRACAAVCIANSTCRCDNGYSRVDKNSDLCVLEKDCPPPKPTCPRNQTATNCIPCNQVCNSEHRFCALACIENSTFCECSNGYVLLDADSDRCVLEKDCPGSNSCSPPEKHCRPGEKYTTCGTCDGTCSNPSPPCTLQCRVGCYCDQGNVRNGKGVCIPKWKCPRN